MGERVALEWVGEWLLRNEQRLSYIMAIIGYIWWDDDDIHFVLDQHAYFDFYVTSSLKQQPTGRNIVTIWHIILILNLPIVALTTYYRGSSGEAANTNFIVFGLTRTRREPTRFHTRGEHATHYTTDVVCYGMWQLHKLVLK